jgi:hypothetical protein
MSAGMHVTDLLLGDAAGRCGSADELRTAAAPLAISLLGHARIEEETLFAPLEAHIGTAGPVHCLREEHVEMDRRLRALFAPNAPGDVGALRDAVRDVLAIVRRHFAKEEQVLFEVARTALAAAALEDLGAAWVRARGLAAHSNGLARLNCAPSRA